MPRPARFLPLLLTLAACASAPVAPPRVLLLGEVHDNAAGHALRAEQVRMYLATGWKPALAMEQFDTAQQAALDAAMARCPDAACVIQAVAPGKSGWTWTHYAPLLDLAKQHGLTVVAANLSRADASQVVKDGFAAALPSEVIARYRLDALPPALLAAQEAEVRESHCGALPDAMVAPMARAQIARDVVMAEAMRVHAANGVVLVAGNGHVRTDIGVPAWLRATGLASHATGFVEAGDHGVPFDAVVTVPTATRADPCAGFRPPKAG